MFSKKIWNVFGTQRNIDVKLKSLKIWLDSFTYQNLKKKRRKAQKKHQNLVTISIAPWFSTWFHSQNKNERQRRFRHAFLQKKRFFLCIVMPLSLSLDGYRDKYIYVRKESRKKTEQRTIKNVIRIIFFISFLLRDLWKFSVPLLESVEDLRDEQIKL